VNNARLPDILCIIVIVVRFIIHLLFNFCSLFSFDYFVLLNFHCSLFIGKIFNSDPGLYSRYFDPVTHHHLSKSMNIIHQTALSLSYYRSEWPITIIDIEGIYETNIRQDQASTGQDTSLPSPLPLLSLLGFLFKTSWFLLFSSAFLLQPFSSHYLCLSFLPPYV
jgi:hypothetical protein